MLNYAENKVLQTKVLIVEDDKLTRIGLKCSLGEFSKNIKLVGEASCAEDGIELAIKHRPNVVLMDLTLPHINGIEAVKIIRKKVPDVKNIMFTVHKNEQDVLGALNAGASAYCIKGIDPDDLFNVIKIVARGGCWIDPAVSEFAFKLFTRKENVPCFHIDKPIEEQVKFTEREVDVLRLIVQGKSNVEISNELFISRHTAKAHVGNILAKFGVNDRTQAAVKAVRERWI